MIPGGFTDERIMMAIEGQSTKFHLANYHHVHRDQPIYKVTYLNETLFEILMQYQALTKV